MPTWTAPRLPPPVKTNAVLPLIPAMEKRPIAAFDAPRRGRFPVACGRCRAEIASQRRTRNGVALLAELPAGCAEVPSIVAATMPAAGAHCQYPMFAFASALR